MTKGGCPEEMSAEPGAAPREAMSEPPPMPFVVGVPRSGTTLLRLMLDAHSQVAIPPETYFFFRLVKAHRAGTLDTAERLFSLVTATSVWEDFGVGKPVYLEQLRRLDPFTPSAGLRTFYALYARRFGKARWGDKTPRYALILPVIEELLPEARFIHVIRDGRDVALSLRDTWFAPAEDMPGLAQFWKEQIEQTRLDGAGRRHYLEVRYEDLVHRTRDTLELICGFVDLPFDEGMESYHRTAERRLADLQPHYNPDGSVKVSLERRLFIHRYSGQPPTETRIGRWREEMPADERLAFDGVAGELLDGLGYDR